MSSILLLISNKGRPSLGQETAEFNRIYAYYHHLSSSTIIYHHLSSSIIVYHHLSSSIIIYHHLSSSIIIYHHLHTSATSADELSPSPFPNGLGMPWWSQHECHLRDHHSLSQGNQDHPRPVRRRMVDLEANYAKQPKWTWQSVTNNVTNTYN